MTFWSKQMENPLKKLSYAYFLQEKRKADININKELAIFIVAFNNATVIKWQILLLQKYVPDSALIIADNSNDKMISNEIMDICIEKNVFYIKLPRNPFQNSKSHGVALNWICSNILDKLKVPYIGFLDHDCFPIKKVNMIDTLRKQDFYGVRQERGGKWYLWPGFAFFSLRNIAPAQLDFLPNEWGDTGAENYNTVFKDYDDTKLQFAVQSYQKLEMKADTEYTQETTIEYFDEKWLHMMNASNWLGINMKSKEEKIFNILADKYSRKE